MQKSEILLLLDELLELPPGTLLGKESVEAWDSLVVIGLMALADEYFDRCLSSLKMREFKTVDDVVLFLSDK